MPKDFCKAYKQYDTRGKCEVPCDTKEKIKRCFNEVALKIHPDKHKDETKRYTKLFQQANSLRNENIEAIDEVILQEQRNITYGRELTSHQKFSIFVLNVFLFASMKFIKDVGDDINIIKGGGKENKPPKQNGGIPVKVIIGIIVALFLFLVLIIDDGSIAHQRIFAGDLKAVLEENGLDTVEIENASNSYFDNDTPSIGRLYATPLSPLERLAPPTSKISVNVGKFIPYSNYPYSVFGLPINILNNDIARIASSIDLEDLQKMVQSLVSVTNKREGKVLIEFNRSQELVIEKTFFKKFTSKFEEDNKEYIIADNSLSCEDIENCGDLYNKITNPQFLLNRIPKMATRIKNPRTITAPNVRVEINEIVAEWSFYYKHSILKDILINMNVVELQLHNEKITFNEYKKVVYELLKGHLLRVSDIERDVALIATDIKIKDGSINKMIDNIVAKSERNKFNAVLQDYVVGPISSTVTYAVGGTAGFGASVLMIFLNTFLENLQLSRKGLLNLSIILLAFLAVMGSIATAISWVCSSFSIGLISGYLKVIGATGDVQIETLKLQVELQRMEKEKFTAMQAANALIQQQQQQQLMPPQSSQLMITNQPMQQSLQFALTNQPMSPHQSSQPMITHQSSQPMITHQEPAQPRRRAVTQSVPIRRRVGGGKKSRKISVNKYKSRKTSVNKYKSRKHKNKQLNRYYV